MKKEKTLYMPRTANELLELYLTPDPNHNPDCQRLSALRDYLDDEISEDELLEQYDIVAEETNIEKDVLEIEQKLFTQAFKNFAEQFAKAQRKLCDDALWACDTNPTVEQSDSIINIHTPQLADLDHEELMEEWFFGLDQSKAKEIMGDDAQDSETQLQERFIRGLWWKKLAYHERTEIYVHKKVLEI